MATKLSELIKTKTLSDDDLIYVVLPGNPPGDGSRGIIKSDLAAEIGNSPLAQNPIENEYADITALLADQSNQTTAFFQYVIDASDDPNITSGDAYYEKLSTSTATLATDYRLLSDTEETILVTGSNTYRIFRISAVQDDTSPLTSVSGGKIGVEFNTGTGKVTGFLFNKITSTSIANIITQSASVDFFINAYNKKNNTYEVAKITGFATVNTDFQLASVENTITAADMGVNDRLEVFFDIDVSGGGGGDTLPIVDSTAVVKGSSDATKLVRIEADALTTSTTRVINMPDVDVTLATPTELTKLAGIETAADVTDNANVNAAGVIEYVWEFAFGDETSDLSVSTGNITFDMPDFATTLTKVSVNVVTAPTGSVATFDLNEAGTTVLSTKVTIDATEKSSETADTAPVISDSALAANATMSVDTDGIGSTIAGAGGKMIIYFKRA